MDVRTALKEQYHGGLAMLRQCVERCPEDLWLAGQPTRPYWRIAYHVCFYTHFYLGQNKEALQPWSKFRDDWLGLEEQDPVADGCYSRHEILEYIDEVDELVDRTIDTLDLDTEDSGFWWYKNISKLSHELMTLRHLQGHVGQLSELLMARGIDIDWVAKA